MFEKKATDIEADIYTFVANSKMYKRAVWEKVEKFPINVGMLFEIILFSSLLF